MEDLAFVFGLLGSITAASIFFPQVWASFKSKHTKDLAWSTILIGMLNGLFWGGLWIVEGGSFHLCDQHPVIHGSLPADGAEEEIRVKGKGWP